MPHPIHHSVGFSFCGLAQVWKEERSFRFESLGLVIALVGGFWLGLNTQEWIAVALASGLVLCAEVANTVVEGILDHLHPARHDTVGKIKDMAAGMVLLSVLTAVVVAALIVWSHLRIS